LRVKTKEVHEIVPMLNLETPLLPEVAALHFYKFPNSSRRKNLKFLPMLKNFIYGILISALKSTSSSPVFKSGKDIQADDL